MESTIETLKNIKIYADVAKKATNDAIEAMRAYRSCCSHKATYMEISENYIKQAKAFLRCARFNASKLDVEHRREEANDIVINIECHIGCSEGAFREIFAE